MRRISYSYQDGTDVQQATFTFPESPKPDFVSCGLFAFAKSGSVLANAIIADLMAAAQVPVVDWPTSWHGQGIDMSSIQGDLSLLLPDRGYCFSGFREIPRSFLGVPAIRKLRKIMVVRDPRDILVSRYFSTKYSHGFSPRGTSQFAQLMRQIIEDAECDVDQYCLRCSWMVTSEFFLHRDIIRDPSTLVVRYEDFIYDQAKLVRDANEWFQLGLSTDELARISEKYGSIPDAENPAVHVRQAHPGDHKRKLKPETIDALDRVLKDYMSAFGYRQYVVTGNAKAMAQLGGRRAPQ
jgi:Sulfotransferase domain